MEFTAWQQAQQTSGSSWDYLSYPGYLDTIHENAAIMPTTFSLDSSAGKFNAETWKKRTGLFCSADVS